MLQMSKFGLTKMPIFEELIDCLELKFYATIQENVKYYEIKIQ